jgi:hypothetical protein
MNKILAAGLLATIALAPRGFAQFGPDEAEPAEVRPDPFAVFVPRVPSVAVPAIAPVVIRSATLAPLQPVAAWPEPDLAEPDDDRAFAAPAVPVRRAVAVTDDDEEAEILGRLSANPFASDSTANPFSPAGSPSSPRSINNPTGPYGSPVSPTSARNPQATDAPRLVAEDGTYLGRLSSNPTDPESVANPTGRYGSPQSPTSINNPYSPYGSPFSPMSPHNPFSTRAPKLLGE